MTAFETIRLAAGGDGLWTITLDRPKRRNSFDATMLRELDAAVDEINADPSAKVMVLRGSREAFCAGRDLAELAEVGRRESSRPVPPSGGHESGMFRRLEVPSVAVAEGPAVGGGLGLFLQCDIRIAADQVRLIDGHLAHGMVSSVPSWYLPRLGSIATALEVLGSRDGVSGARAAEIGLVDVAVPADQVDVEVKAVIERLVCWDGELLRHTILLLRLARVADYDTTMHQVGLLRAVRRRAAGGEHE